MQDTFRPRRRRIKKKIRWSRLFLLVIIFSLTVGLSYFLVSGVFNMFFSESSQPQIIVPVNTQPDQAFLDSRINVLIMGVDGAPGIDNDIHRTDSLILASFNRLDKGVSVLSIPRDTRAQIPGRDGYEKINHAYAYGGEKLTCQTVANFLNVPIHKYVIVDNKSFIKVIDALDGVGVYVENDMYYEDPHQNLLIDIKKGYQKLNGEESLKYIRFRNDELGDIGRVLRQQKFLKTFAQELFSFHGISKTLSLKSVIQESVQTDLDMFTMLKMVNSFKQYSTEAIDFDMLPGEFATIEEVSYWVADSYKISTGLDKLGITYIK